MDRNITFLLYAVFFTVNSIPVVRNQNEKVHNQPLIWKTSAAANHSKHKPGSFCFGVQCRCKGTKADCSQNYGNLTFVPKLPEKTEFLNFSYNDLTAITRSNFFANVSQLQSVDLGDNNLTYIHPSSFEVFHNLSGVFVDYNYQLTMQAMAPILSTSTLRRLDLRHGGLLTLPEDIFRRFPLPRLETLYLHENKLEKLNFTTLMPLKKLTDLGLAGNPISQLVSDRMPSLERLNLEYGSLSHFPVTCREGASLFPRLTQLLLARNQISAITGEVCLPELKLLELTRNQISHFVADMFGAHRFPSLANLQLQSQGSLRKTVDAHAFRNPNLEILNLMYNDLSFNRDFVHADCFKGCPSLLNLQLSHSFFEAITHEKWQRLFEPLRTLQKLFLGAITLKRLFRDSFQNLPSLQELHLYQNSLSDLPDGVFDHLNLTHLGVEVNKITTIRESTFSARTRNRLVSLDLSGNPFLCTCSLLWFQAWFLSRPALFSHSRRDYLCANLPRTHLRSFAMNPQACLLSHDAYVFILISVTMVMAATIWVSALYRYRWHIRLLMYEAFRGRNAELRQRRLREQQFDYDVFVSYAIEDSDWVIKYLTPRLEEGWRLRLCLHQRDFVPGKNIADNIVDSVQGSKKVLMIFSPSFAASPWCQFELNFCLRHVMDFDDALVVVRLCDVTSRDMTSTMVAVHKVTTYIQWEEGAEVEASFWGRLKIAFQEILPPPPLPS